MQPIHSLAPLLFVLGLMIISLLVESFLHKKRLNSIPVRIAVTGTRGKTTTTRILASILRESGKSVLAKTTGSEAKYILPDGSEKKIKRIGPANIIEQKRLVRMASSLKVEYLLAEQMSIQPEIHKIEAHRLLKPQYTILTNMRPDHLDAAIDSGMSSIFSNDLIKGSTVVFPVDEIDELMEREMASRKIKMIGIESSIDGKKMNILLASRMAMELGCLESEITKGCQNFNMDRGGLSASSFQYPKGEIIFINSFAANDPLSSKLIIDSVLNNQKWKDYKIFGLLSLRSDRGDRTVHWIKYLKENTELFDERLFFAGMHAKAVSLRIKKGYYIKSNKPEMIMNEIVGQCKGPSIVFGLANIKGLGFKMIDYWTQKGERIKLETKI